MAGYILLDVLSTQLHVDVLLRPHVGLTLHSFATSTAIILVLSMLSEFCFFVFFKIYVCYHMLCCSQELY